MTDNRQMRFPHLDRFDIPLDPEPGEDRHLEQDIMTSDQEEQKQDNQDQEEQAEQYTIMKLEGIETPIALLFDKEAAQEVREAHPEAALWSEAAFHRFMEDHKNQPTEVKRKALAGASLVKTAMGGTYRGIEVSKGKTKRRKKDDSRGPDDKSTNRERLP